MIAASTAAVEMIFNFPSVYESCALVGKLRVALVTDALRFCDRQRGGDAGAPPPDHGGLLDIARHIGLDLLDQRGRQRDIVEAQRLLLTLFERPAEELARGPRRG